jgi:hypothetical protein
VAGGSGQASLSLFLRMCDTEPLTEELATEVGALAGKADHDDVVDVSVVEGAVRRGDAIVTSNSIRTRKIAEAADADPNIEFI